MSAERSSPSIAQREEEAPALRVLRRGLGALILLLTLTPVYRVLDWSGTGSFGVGTVIRGDTNLETAWWGILLAAGLGGGLALLGAIGPLLVALRRLGEWASRVPAPTFAVGVGTVATLLGLATGSLVFSRLPTLVDGMATLLHGRILAGGTLALPLPGPAAAWVIPNTLVTPLGWVSQYPPLHPLLLALGFLVSAPWLVGPLCLGVTVAFGFLITGRLFPEAPGVSRFGGALLAASPFLVFLSGGYLSHVPAAAAGAFTLWATLKARDAGWGWAVAAGLGSGAMVATRPWTGLVVAVAFPAFLWAAEGWRKRGWGWTAVRFGGAVIGGLPMAAGLALHNARLFGSPLTLGFSLAYGPPHDLGFHRDPWGNLYGPVEALGYSAANLLTLGVYLLETALPALALVGAFLLLARRLPRGTGVLLGWALLPALANVFYWHHGFHLGPRMLYEGAPAWVLLTALAAVQLSRREAPGNGGSAPGEGRQGQPRSVLARLHPRDVLLGALLLSLLGIPILVSLRASSYAWTEETLVRIRAPEVPGTEPALVFVHGSWEERIAARLQGAGMRLDSIESALRRNDVCRLHSFAQAWVAGGGATSSADQGIDFDLLPDTPAHLRLLPVSEGEDVWVDPSLGFTPDCQREARADRGGIVSLAPLLWQGDLPGIEGGKPLFVRDLGPDENAAVLAAFPHRKPFLYLIPDPGWDPELRGYQEGMGLLWGGTHHP